ncbi:MAG: hypothetical protein QOE75_2798 [Solirubrobacterales bacterium]|jgi:hypothetical protein|nr:hypothetical protein [Solirubrobacterales bacterium]
MFEDPDNHRVLVIAGEAADYPGLIAGLQGAEAESTSYTLLVPGWPEAVGRAERASARMRAAGLELEETIVGDADPFLAAGDVLHVRHFDEIVVADARKMTRHFSADLYTSVH